MISEFVTALNGKACVSCGTIGRATVGGREFFQKLSSRTPDRLSQRSNRGTNAEHRRTRDEVADGQVLPEIMRSSPNTSKVHPRMDGTRMPDNRTSVSAPEPPAYRQSSLCVLQGRRPDENTAGQMETSPAPRVPRIRDWYSSRSYICTPSDVGQITTVAALTTGPPHDRGSGPDAGHPGASARLSRQAYFDEQTGLWRAGFDLPVGAGTQALCATPGPARLHRRRPGCVILPRAPVANRCAKMAIIPVLLPCITPSP